MASAVKLYGTHMTWVLSPSSKLAHSAYKTTVPCGNPNEKLPFAFAVPVTVFFFMVKRDTECYAIVFHGLHPLPSFDLTQMRCPSTS